MTTEIVGIGDRQIGPGQPCFLIVEVGTTSLGDINNALKLVEACAEAGVDAAKFQVIDPDQLSDTTVEYGYSSGGKKYSANMKEMFSTLQFTRDEWRQIRDACHERGLMFFSTVDYATGVDIMEELDVPVHKMGAWDVTYRPLVEKIGRTGKSLFVDLGPCTDSEADDLVNWYRASGGLAVLFLHDFHTQKESQMNMKAIAYLAKKHPWPVGFSSPGRDDDLDLVALGMGAHFIEKRLILSRELKTFHADESLEPTELKAWVQRIRRVEASLGREDIVPSDDDARMSKNYYRSICTMLPVAKGELLTAKNLDGKRPGTGIPTNELSSYIGKRATRDLPVNHLLEQGDAG